MHSPANVSINFGTAEWHVFVQIIVFGLVIWVLSLMLSLVLGATVGTCNDVCAEAIVRAQSKRPVRKKRMWVRDYPAYLAVSDPEMYDHRLYQPLRWQRLDCVCVLWSGYNQKGGMEFGFQPCSVHTGIAHTMRGRLKQARSPNEDMTSFLEKTFEMEIASFSRH